jgi:hypothetical protein
MTFIMQIELLTVTLRNGYQIIVLSDRPEQFQVVFAAVGNETVS